MKIPPVIVHGSQLNIRETLNKYIGVECVDIIIPDGKFTCVSFTNTCKTDAICSFVDSLINGVWIDNTYFVTLQYI